MAVLESNAPCDLGDHLRRLLVKVDAIDEQLPHQRIARQHRRNAQLQLRVIELQHHVTGSRRKTVARDLRFGRVAARNVLKIRLLARRAPRTCAVEPNCWVDTIVGSDVLKHRFGIRRPQLADAPVLDDVVDDRVLPLQRRKRFFVRRRLARLR